MYEQPVRGLGEVTCTFEVCLQRVQQIGSFASIIAGNVCNLVLVNIPQVIHPCDFVEVAVDPQVIEVSDADTPIPVKILPHLQRFAALGKPSPVVANALAWITDADIESYIVLDQPLAAQLPHPPHTPCATCIF